VLIIEFVPVFSVIRPVVDGIDPFAARIVENIGFLVFIDHHIERFLRVNRGLGYHLLGLLEGTVHGVVVVCGLPHLGCVEEGRLGQMVQILLLRRL
jgi:hypothetical protein